MKLIPDLEPIIYCLFISFDFCTLRVIAVANSLWALNVSFYVTCGISVVVITHSVSSLPLQRKYCWRLWMQQIAYLKENENFRTAWKALLTVSWLSQVFSLAFSCIISGLILLFWPWSLACATYQCLKSLFGEDGEEGIKTCQFPKQKWNMDALKQKELI